MKRTCGPETQVGEPVVYTGSSRYQVQWGGNDDPEKAGLKINVVYVVEEVEIHSSHTKLRVKGFEGRFNSVSFEPMEDD